MAEDCGAVVPAVAAFAVQAIGQEGVASRGVDHEPRLPVLHRPVFVAYLNLHRRRANPQIHRVHAGAFDDLGAGARGMADQDLVELGAADLIGIGHGLVPGVAEAEVLLPAIPRGDEFGAPFLHADGAYFLRHAELFEQRQVGRQQGLANVKARMTRLLDHRDPMTAPCQQCRGGGAGWAPADDEHVGLAHAAAASSAHGWESSLLPARQGAPTRRGRWAGFTGAPRTWRR